MSGPEARKASRCRLSPVVCFTGTPERERGLAEDVQPLREAVGRGVLEEVRVIYEARHLRAGEVLQLSHEAEHLIGRLRGGGGRRSLCRRPRASRPRGARSPRDSARARARPRGSPPTSKMTRSQSLSKAEATAAGIFVCVRPFPTKVGETSSIFFSESMGIWSDMRK